MTRVQLEGHSRTTRENASQVTAYPVDFRTGTTTPWTEYALARSLLLWQTALHEWLGRGVYAFTR